jgi:hypothetical protein
MVVERLAVMLNNRERDWYTVNSLEIESITASFPNSISC